MAIKLSLKLKLIFGFMIVIILFGIAVIIALFSSNKINTYSHRLEEKTYPILEKTKNLVNDLKKINEVIITALSEGDTEQLKKTGETAESFKTNIKALYSLSDDEEVKDIDALFQTYFNIAITVSNGLLSGAGVSSEDSKLMQLNEKAKELNERLERYHSIKREEFITNLKNISSTSRHFRNLLMITFIICLFAGIGVAILIASKCTNSLNTILEFLKDISNEGWNLTNKKIEIATKDEIGEVAEWFNIFIEKLNSVIIKVATVTNQITSSAEQMANSARDMTKGAESQTAQTIQVATAIEQMSATVLEVAKHSSDAAQSSQEAAKLAKEGAGIVTQTIEGMNNISQAVRDSANTILELGKSSDQIGEIISVIDDIADQTNLLALNAAIEAARAGEQGRGFAVVADEVRKLAERTTKATKEIATMIKTIQTDTSGAVKSMEAGTKEVEVGVKFANDAGDALKQISKAVHDVTERVQHIATAAEEQSAAADEISANVEKVASVAKETSKESSQSLSGAEKVTSLSLELQKLVRGFNIKL